MDTDPITQQDYSQNGVSNASAQNAGQSAAQNGEALSPQQPNEDAAAYAARQAAYNANKK